MCLRVVGETITNVESAAYQVSYNITDEDTADTMSPDLSRVLPASLRLHIVMNQERRSRRRSVSRVEFVHSVTARLEASRVANDIEGPTERKTATGESDTCN